MKPNLIPIEKEEEWWSRKIPPDREVSVTGLQCLKWWLWGDSLISPYLSTMQKRRLEVVNDEKYTFLLEKYDTVKKADESPLKYIIKWESDCKCRSLRERESRVWPVEKYPLSRRLLQRRNVWLEVLNEGYTEKLYVHVNVRLANWEKAMRNIQ